jgi:abortive infection bacteriophage resistance protein
LPFKQNDEKYHAGTSFKKVYRLYEFDRKLRTLLFVAVARIEIFLRSQFAYYHTKQYGPLGYMDAVNFHAKYHNHERFLKLINDITKKNEKVLFVQHHLQKYNGQFPLWVISELFTFGMLSRFYADLQTYDQKKLSKELFGLNPKTLISWLRCCTDLRNNCAHHGRLYYRIFPAIPAGFEKLSEKEKRRLFSLLLVLKGLYSDTSVWDSEILTPLCELIDEYQSDVQLQHIGFPHNWKEAL